MVTLKRLLLRLLLGSAVWSVAQKSSAQQKSSTPPPSSATEAWQKEFDDICSKTQDAMAFSVDELKTLVKRCDVLDPQLEKLDETRKKVFQRRLRQCRGLFAYVLESKQSDSKQKE